MKALLYMWKKSLHNRLARLKKKPSHLILGLLFIAYMIFVATMGFTALAKAHFKTPYWLVAALSVWCFYNFFINSATYAKRKGIIFYPSHAHFVFTAPIKPKVILLFGAAYNMLSTMIMSILFVIASVVGFHLPVWKVLALFVVTFVIEAIFECSVIILLYANERFSECTSKWIARSIYLLLAGVTLFGIWYFYTKGFSFQSVMRLVDDPAVQMLPVVGWNIAVFRLIVLGPTTLNMVCASLYFVTVLLFVFAAYKMKCQGNYFEDAAKFADDYAEMKTRKNSGEFVMSIGKKRKFKHASVTYKATGAKAIFYRQLLEYKKEKWFIFSYMTVFCIVADLLILYVIDFSHMQPKNMFLLGVTAYLAILTGGYMGKWDKELKTPYIYLMPDSPVKKMWYATVIEHVKAAIDGAILVIPLGIAWKVNPVQMLICWLLYIALQAIKLYTKVLIDSFAHGRLGEQLKQIIRMGVQCGIIGIGIAIAAVASIVGNDTIAFGVVLLYGIFMAVLISMLTVSKFAVMEQYD